jgi:hypothetical protein
VSTTLPRDDRPRRRRGLGWLPALALLILLAILLLARSCGGDDDNGSAGGGNAPAGSITAGGEDVLARAKGGGSLAGLSGKSVSANAVPVQSVVNDSGFWVGTSEADRVFVEAEDTGSGTSLGLQAGDQVSFDGTLEQNKEAETYGLRANQGAQQFREQGYHVRVQADDVEQA